MKAATLQTDKYQELAFLSQHVYVSFCLSEVGKMVLWSVVSQVAGCVHIVSKPFIYMESRQQSDIRLSYIDVICQSQQANVKNWSH